MARIRVAGVSKKFGKTWGLLGSRASGTYREEQFGRGAATHQREEEDVRDTKLTPDGGVKALDDVSIEIGDGEAVSIIGPSGCGKTTLLRVIAGLEAPDRGRVYYDDVDTTDVAPKDRGIGIVFQSYALYPHMDSKRNLGFFFQMHQREREIDERVRITAEILGIGFDELLERRPKQLSGGQQQRVAIGRCIVRDPRLFLFDEPLSNLDARLRARTRVEVKRLLHRFKITTVYVTHDQTEAIALGDRIAIMCQGRIEQLGTYWDAYERPVNQFVAGFLGVPPMNFLAAEVVEGALRFPGGSLPLPDHLLGAAPARGSVTVGLRPEHVRLEPTSAPGFGHFGHFANAVVEVVEPLPSDRVQIVHLGGEGFDCKATIPLDMPVQTGDDFSLTADRSRIYLFDAVTERNLVR